MRGSPSQVAAWLRARAARAPRVLDAAIRVSLDRARAEAAAATPVDTGAARRSWRVVRGPAGWLLRNDRPRSRVAAGGRIYTTALRITGSRIRADRRAIARHLKEG